MTPPPSSSLLSLNVVCLREAVSEKHHLAISDHFSSHVFWKWARWATKGKKNPYGSFVPRSSFCKACWGEVEGMKLCPGIFLKHRERLKFCCHLRIVWMRVSVCVSYGNVSLSHFVVWGEKAGKRRLAWQLCLGHISLHPEDFQPVLFRLCSFFLLKLLLLLLFFVGALGPRRQQLIWLELEDQEWRAESHWAVSEGAWLWKIWSQGWGRLSPAAVN